MKKLNLRKYISLIMALLMSFTSFAGIVTPVSAAAGEKTDVYIVHYPRSEDVAFSNKNWGHGDMKFMNGWKCDAIDHISFRGMGSYSGPLGYCIEPGIDQYTGDTLTKHDESYFNNISANDIISGSEIKVLIGRILQYGYCGNISTDWVTQNEQGINKLAHAYATQLLIWETIVGERDYDFNYRAPVGYNSTLDQISTLNPIYEKTMSYYRSMEESVKNHAKLPSFCAQSGDTAQTYEFKWDGSKYTAMLTDTNNVLSDYTFKADVDGVSFSVNGNKLTVSSETLPDKEFTITAQKNGTRMGIVVWSDGKYSRDEGIQDVVTYSQKVSDTVNGYMKMKASYGSCQIIKTSEDGKVDGINFTISGNGINKTVTTADGGKIQIDNLLPGVYTVTEQSYDKYEPQESHRVTVVSGQKATVTFNNTLKRGELQVVKSSEDNFNEGVTFHLYGTSLSGIAVDEYAVTDKNGVAKFEDVLISGDKPYTLEEVDTAIRYVIPEGQSAPVKWNEVTTRNFTNILKKFTVTVTKSDAETGTAQGNASLANAKYGIFKGDQLIDEYYTDENGQFTTKEYICDSDWTIKELEPSEGYLLDPTVHKVGAEPELYTIEHNQTANDVNEQVIKGNIAIIKHTDNGDTQIETPEEGAVFEVYLKSAGSFANANESERDTLTCDEKGFAQTKDLPYGVYTVHQVSGWEGCELMDDFDVLISQDGQTYRYLINNAYFESYIQVVKVDSETGKTIPYAGAGFQIYDPAGNLVTMQFTYPTPTTVDTFYTDANGSLVTPEKLPYGKGYSIIEVQSPYGYVLDSTPVYFDITEENSSEESGVTVIKVEKSNMPQKGTITIEKTGEVFFGVSVSGGTDENGQELPVIYQPIYETQGLPNTVYEIRAAEDVVTPDGTLRYSKGELVDTVTTDKNGFAKSCELYLGKYEVKEVKAGYGMVVSDEAHTVELAYAGQNVAVTETATSFVNERQKVEVSLEKALETSELFGIGNNGEIKNISFGLFADEEIVSASGTSIPKDGLIEIITLGENGKATVKTDLPLGSYYVKELATDEHYQLSGEKYPVVFEYVGQETAIVKIDVNDGEPIENKLIYGSVFGKKVDENGEGLGGALIGLFKTDGVEFTKENAIMTAVSGYDGSFSFENVPYGNWYIREIEQPTGFVLNDTVYDVNISENGQTIEIEIVNELVRGNIALTKVDAEYTDTNLTGAVFEVYKDSNDNGELDKEDEFIGTLTEKEIGQYEMNDLLYGRYFLKETKAPDGFIPDEGVYEVFIDTDGKTYQVENTEGKGFSNEPMRGNLKIVKTSSDGKVEGFAFRITGENGYDITLETDENGEIFLEGLRIGEYKISEVNNSASAMYVLPSDKQATVQASSTTIVEMYNELRDIPKTGDNSKLGLWLALGGASVAGIAICRIFGSKKKKKENK